MQDYEARVPTHLWVEGKIRELSTKGVGVYVLHKGERMNGLLLLKIHSKTSGYFQLLTQQRNFDGVLEWISVFSENEAEEAQVDAYIKRSIDRDPDLWVIEVEDSSNPFEL